MLYGSFVGLDQPSDNYEESKLFISSLRQVSLTHCLQVATEAYFQRIHCNSNKTVTTTFWLPDLGHPVDSNL